jgi:O-antigen/teichoic acid export membrane protein
LDQDLEASPTQTSPVGRLGSDMVVYGLSLALSRSLNFLLLPLVTRVLSPAEYGQIETINVALNFWLIILTLGSQISINNFFFQLESKGDLGAGSRVVSAAVQWFVVWGSSWVVLTIAGWPLLEQSVFHGQLEATLVGTALIASYFSQLNQMALTTFRCLFRPWSYLGVSVLGSVVGAGVTYACLYHFGQKAVAVFLGLLAGAVISNLVAWISLRRLVTLIPQSDLWPRMMKLELPLVPVGLLVNLLNGTDRWFVGTYLGQSALGTYAVAARFALLMQLLVESFRQAWMPHLMQSLATEEGPQTLRRVSRIYLAFALSAVLWLAAGSRPLLELMVPAEFAAAYPITGLLAWSAAMYGFFSIATAGMWKQGRTSLMLVSTAIAAFASIGLNFTLGTRLGSLGSGLASAIATTLWAFLTLAISERLWPVGFPALVLSSLLAVAATGLGAIEWLNIHCHPWWQAVVVALLASFLLTVLGLGRTGIKKAYNDFASR